MTSYLYVFPHPDDESFGPGPAAARQVREGHELHLLTLTRGGATKQRHRLGYTVREMGRVRERELREAAEVLGFAGVTVLDFPDDGLKEVDPLDLEAAVRREIDRVEPDVLVTYPVHGISGFDDHLVTHAVVKRVFCALRAAGDPRSSPAPRRLAFFTLGESDRPDGPFDLNTSEPEEIDVAVRLTEEDIEQGKEALDRYETYRPVVEEARPLERLGEVSYYELFGESHDPRLSSLDEDLG